MKLADYVIIWTESIPAAKVVADVVRAQGGELLAAGSEPGKMVERSGICSRSCWRDAVS